MCNELTATRLRMGLAAPVVTTPSECCGQVQSVTRIASIGVDFRMLTCSHRSASIQNSLVKTSPVACGTGSVCTFLSLRTSSLHSCRIPLYPQPLILSVYLVVRRRAMSLRDPATTPAKPPQRHLGISLFATTFSGRITPRFVQIIAVVNMCSVLLHT